MAANNQPNRQIKVINDGVGTVGYALPELNNLRRIFTAGETKEVPLKELTALWQIHGGAELIKHELRITDEDWVRSQWPDVPDEYFWGRDEIKNCMVNGTLAELEDALDFAPHRVLAIIKSLSWQLPLADLNKIALINKYLNFDVQAAIKIMAPPEGREPVSTATKQRRAKKEA